MDYGEAQKKMCAAASVIKLVCGVANNASWLVMLDAMDHARQCRRYGGNVKRQFKQCLEMFHAYERKLIYANENRMFHLADMAPEIRKKYGDITDRQYYEFWTSTGASAYQRTQPEITSLANKYRLSLQKHGAKDAEHVAWVMTAMASLELAGQLYERIINESVKSYGLPRRIFDHVFSQFSLSEISKAWCKAMCALAPESVDYKLDDVEERNIELGLIQLQDAWLDTDTLYDSVSDAVDDYDEVFRTKGEQKKALREIATVKSETEKEL